jgi:hypothetical protein
VTDDPARTRAAYEEILAAEDITGVSRGMATQIKTLGMIRAFVKREINHDQAAASIDGALLALHSLDPEKMSFAGLISHALVKVNGGEFNVKEAEEVIRLRAEQGDCEWTDPVLPL